MSTTESKLALSSMAGSAEAAAVVLDLIGHPVDLVYLEDLAPDLVLVLLDVRVGVDLLGPQVGRDLNRPLAEDVALEDVGQAGLGVDREHQHPVALLGQPEGGRRREGGLAQPPLPPN